MSGGPAANTKTTNKPARRPGSRRRLLAWTLLSAAALVVVLWVVSGWWWSLGVSTPRGIFGVTRGAFYIQWYGQGGGAWTAHIGSAYPRMLWWFGREGGVFAPSNGTTRFGVGIVDHGTAATGLRWTTVELLLWPIALLTTLSGTGLLISARRARRRALTHHCPACGYDLIGLPPNAPCPECGPKSK